jgi:hypothetical protein
VTVTLPTPPAAHRSRALAGGRGVDSGTEVSFEVGLRFDLRL